MDCPLTHRCLTTTLHTLKAEQPVDSTLWRTRTTSPGEGWCDLHPAGKAWGRLLGETGPLVLPPCYFCSGPQNVPHIWEKEHQVGARATQGGLPGPEVSPDDVRWGCLTLNLLPTSEGQVWALEEKVFQQVFNPFHRAQQTSRGAKTQGGVGAWRQSLPVPITAPLAPPVQVCFPAGPRAGHLRVARGPGHTE